MIALSATFVLSFLVIFILYKYFLFPLCLSSLSKIPNAHFTSAFSPCWILWQRFKEEEIHVIHAAHQKHGPIVRLGPRDISVNCVDGGLRTIYTGNFEKPGWYNMFINYDVRNMFSTLDNKSHSLQKRKISNVYSKSYLHASPDMMILSESIIFQRLLPIIHTLAKESIPINMHEFNFAIGMDFVTAYMFGLQNGSNFMRDFKGRQAWLEIFQSRRPYAFWASELPEFVTITWLLKNLRFQVTPSWVDIMDKKLESSCLEMCDAAKLLLKSAPPAPTRIPIHMSNPVVYKQLSQSYTETNNKSLSPSQDLEIASELLDHLGAGHETTGVTLTYYLHQLSQRPSLQASLRAELLTLTPTVTYQSNPLTLPSPRSIDALPLLHATLMETLRRYTAIPGPQPRLTPKTPTSLAGSLPLPAGIRVSASAYCLHRNKEVFPDPESWLPERWINQTKERTDEMMRWFWAFGSGGRMCIGSHFAIQEMKLVIAAIYTNFTTHIVNDTGIEQIDAYVSGPRANQLILKFERV